MFDTNDDGLLSELEVQQLVEHGIREAGKWWRPWHWDKSCPLPKFFTWNLKMMVSNRNLLFQGLIFRFHVELQGCKSLWSWSLPMTMPLVGIHQTISDRRMTSIFQPTSTFVRQRVQGGIRCLLRNNLSEEVSFAVSRGDISNSSCSRTVELFQEFLFMSIRVANDHVQASEQATLNSTLTDLMLSAVTLPQHQTQEGLEDRHQTCFFLSFPGSSTSQLVPDC